MSKRFHIIISIVIILVSISCAKQEIETKAKADVPSLNPEFGFEPGMMYVKIKDDIISLVEEDLTKGNLSTKSTSLNLALSSLGIQKIERLFPHAGEFEGRTRREGLHKWYIVTYSEDTPLTKVAGTLDDFDGFECVEPVRKIRSDAFNDLVSQLWGFNNNAYKGADINVKKAWEKYTVGNPSVIVSVVDTGIDLTHEDLAANCLKEGHINTINTSRPVEAGTHGTHVAGTIAAVGNNGKGVVGVAGGDAQSNQEGVKLMSCQIFGNNGGSGNATLAIKWGADHGAVISQNSWGYSYDFNRDGILSGSEIDYARSATIDRATKEAVDYFIKYAGCDDSGEQLPDSPMKGGVVIFAAGNDALDNGAPANYGPIIAVGAVKKDGRRTDFSNYGGWVDIAAPGYNIYSTVPGNKYDYLSGTSMACPHVSGVAALVVSYCGGPGFTNTELEEKLIMTANRQITPESDMIGGLVNAFEAMKYGEKGVPGEVVDLKLSAVSNIINIACTVTEDSDGEANGGYLVIYGTTLSEVNSAGPEAMEQVQSRYFENDRNVGESLEMVLDELKFETSYYLKVYAKSREGKYSAPTTLQKMTTKRNNPPQMTVTFDGGTDIRSGSRLDISIAATDIDGHAVNLRHEPGSDAESLIQINDNLWKLTIAYRTKLGEYTSRLTVYDKYGLEVTKTIKYKNEIQQPNL